VIIFKIQFYGKKNFKSYGTLAAGADYALCLDSGGPLVAVVLAARARIAAMLVVTAGKSS